MGLLESALIGVVLAMDVCLLLLAIIRAAAGNWGLAMFLAVVAVSTAMSVAL